jgi:hypothetical protein
LSELLRGWGEIRMVLFALLVLVIVRAYPAGLLGLVGAARQRAGRYSRASPRA